jgi:hypothetical protein
MDEARVRDLVRLLLIASEFEGRPELLDQVEHLRVGGGSATWVDLAVDRGTDPSSFSGDRVPGVCWAYGPSGDPIGTLVLWTSDGYLTSLELGWVTDDRPTELPDPAQVRTAPT